MRTKRSGVRKHVEDRIAANRARVPEDFFTPLERQALRDKLSELTPDREKKKHEHVR